ncbi:NTE family protein RssA [bacterium BMS3Abin03]|nr:NTE family protein RssA [bacterium BMS3Abin03]
MGNEKTGLALGSGGARGLAHIGVLKVLEEKEISIDYISGSSIGALIGAAYSIGMTVKEMEDIASKTNWKMMAKIFLPTLSLSAIINDKYLGEFLYGIFGNKKFEDAKIPLALVATDIDSGKAVVIKSGNLLKAVRASMSLPMLFSPVIYNGRKLIDGGLVNPVPVDIIESEKVDKVIAVNLRGFAPISSSIPKQNSRMHSVKEIDELSLNEKIEFFLKHPIRFFGDKSHPEEIALPKFGSLLYQISIIVQVQMAALTLKNAKPDIIIEPETSSFKIFDFQKADELINIGYKTASSVLDNYLNNYEHSGK